MNESSNDKVVNLGAYKDELEMKGYEDAIRIAQLYFEMQNDKKKLRLQFLEDIKRMMAEGADLKKLLSRLWRHEHAVKTMRMAFDEVAGNERPSYGVLIHECDECYGEGLSEFKERLLRIRPNTEPWSPPQ